MGEIRSTKTRREKWREQDSSHRSLLGAQPCSKHLNRENPILRVVRGEDGVCAGQLVNSQGGTGLRKSRIHEGV